VNMERVCLCSCMLVMLGTIPASAGDGVVVVPLLGGSSLPGPYARVAADSPPNKTYTVGATTVTDNRTGLVWQKSDDNTTRSWEDAWNYCDENPMGLPGTDWRLPGVGELLSLAYYGTYSPAINSVAFPGTDSSPYWSATTSIGSGGSAWYVHFNKGTTVDSWAKSNPYHVRCVRGSPPRGPVLNDNGDGTATDLVTGLTWQREDDGTTRHNDGPAASYCDGLALAGGGWRLPTVKELQSIFEDRLEVPAIDENVFPDTENSCYWSSTGYSSNSSFAWTVDFDAGWVMYYPRSTGYYVRCVR